MRYFPWKLELLSYILRFIVGWSPFLTNLEFWWHATLLKKTPTPVLSCEFYKPFKNNFFEEHLWTSVSKHYLKRDSNTTQNTRTKHKAKSFILQETKDSRLLTKTALKRTSNAIFKMKMVGLDESWLNRETKSNTTFCRKQLC